MRIGIVALLLESNTFLPDRTELSHFEEDVLLEGNEIRDRFHSGNHEISGFFAELDKSSVEPVPIFAARALPYGPIAADTWRELMRRMFDAVRRAGECDGYLVAVHGATTSEEEPDADGFWLAKLREYSGRHTPIVGTLDLHANLSPRMVEACDALVAYRTNPHIDQLECGRKAASLLVRKLHNQIRPTHAAAYPPLAINIERQDTSAMPCRQVYEIANEMLQREKVLSNSVLLGFPYADVAEMGTSVIVVTDDDRNLAQRYANEIANEIWKERQQFLPELVSVDEALAKAAPLDKPVCLLDMGDNVGGGGPADSTWLLHALVERRVARALVCVCDPVAVSRAAAVGVGNTTTLCVGGRSGPMHGRPFEGTIQVMGLYTGKFHEDAPRHGGYSNFDQGPSAVVRTPADVTILLTSRRMAPFSLAQLTSCGLDPPGFDILVAKGVIAPVAAYQSVCRHFIRVNTPGVTTADILELPFANRRRPLYPWETDFDWKTH